MTYDKLVVWHERDDFGCYDDDLPELGAAILRERKQQEK